MSKKSLSTLKLSAAAAILVAGLGVSGITSEAGFDAPYYNINLNGGSFNGNQYVLDNGTTVTDAFFCDGTYTYFLQTDGTPMKDRLTYHPDGAADHVIYFDANGHECFDTFAHVKKNIEGKDVDDLCYFGSKGYLYVNVITYNKEGTAIYYANEYGVMERNGAFKVKSDAVNYSALANGCKYGYANSDGTVKGFYATYEEAVAAGQFNGGNNDADQQQGYWQYFGEITYDGKGKQISRTVAEGNNSKYYVTDEKAGEYLSSDLTEYYDNNQERYGYTRKGYSLKSDGTTYLSIVESSQEPENGNWSYQNTVYNENGQTKSSTVREYNGSDVMKELYNAYWENGKSEIVTVYNYANGKLVSSESNEASTYTYDGQEHAYKNRSVTVYTENENEKRTEWYTTNSDGTEQMTRYTDYSYTIVAGKEVLSREDNYQAKADGTAKLDSYRVYTYDDNANESSSNYYYSTYDNSGTFRLSSSSESTYSYIRNRWIRTRYLSYSSDSNGDKIPNYGYDRYYENNRLTQVNDYRGSEDGNWALDEYTMYNTSYNFPEDTSQITTFDYSRVYDADGTLKRYTVYFYRYVQQ